MTNTREDVWRKIAVGHPGVCWLWRGSTSTNGYGVFDAQTVRYTVHRLTYELLRGPVPDGLVLDHWCRVKLCANPFHLEPVTSRENSLRDTTTIASRNARRTHCPQGHPYRGDNLVRRNGGRFCRKCIELHALSREARRKGITRLTTTSQPPLAG